MYDKASLKKAITDRAKSLGITEIGFCRHNGKTAVCCLFPYFCEGEDKGGLSMYARGYDYHEIVPRLLSQIISPFDPSAELFCDKGPTDNREVAVKSGLGIIGKNQAVINAQLGSWFFIGYALTELEIEPDTPKSSICLNCNACIKACPGNALSNNGFTEALCASHISQKKGELSQEEKLIIKRSGYVFGCDVCQSVCPMNGENTNAIAEFMRDRVTTLDASTLSALSNTEFKEKYKSRAFSWRGKAVLIRNMEILEK